MCWLTNTTINDLTKSFLHQQLVDAYMIPRTTFQSQTASLLSKLDAVLDMSIKAARAAEVMMLMINRNRIHSAVHTNGFHMSAPGSNTYRSVENYYPKSDNTSFNTVSILKTVREL